jgi:hypothetical protein
MRDLKLVIYIAGCYSNGGLLHDKMKESNRDNMRKYAEKFINIGCAVICPIENDEWAYDKGLLTYDEVMESDLALISKSDFIFMCPGWEDGKGAVVEYKFALEYDIPILFEDIFEIGESPKMESTRKLESYCSKCREWYESDKVESINIESNAYGEDVITFNCNNCGTKQKSLVR